MTHMLSHESAADDFALVARLSPREREVLELAAHGLTNLQIAERIHLSVHAVKFHLRSIFGKLGVSNRTEAAVLHLRSSQHDQPVS
jgi:two-component system nitrate/nitrite response regulator NarL